MEETTPRLVPHTTADGLSAHLMGRWTAARLAEPQVWADVNTALSKLPRAHPEAGSSPDSRPAAWDLRQLQSLDHTGAQLLWNTWGRQWPATVHTLPAQRALLERVARYTVVKSTLPEQSFVQRVVSRLWQRYLNMGTVVLHGLDHGRDLIRLLGQLLLDLCRLVRAPGDGPWRDVSGHLYRIGVKNPL